MKNKKEKRNTEKVRRFPKLYVLDIVIVLLLVAIGLGIYFRYNVFDILGNAKDQTSAEVSFVVKNINNTSIDYVEIGDEFYFKDTKNSFGTIMASAENSNRPFTDPPASETIYVPEKNEFVVVHYPENTRIDAEGKLKCKGSFSADGSFMLNGSNYIAPGQMFTVCTEKVTFEITILEISKAGK